VFNLKEEYISKSSTDRLYNIDCPVIGLTGGIATGKSTVSTKLSEKGFPVICADKLVKEVYKTQKTISHLQKYYPQVLNNEGIDFKQFRELFFGDKSIQEDVEKLIYSQMPDMFLSAYHQLNDPSIVIYDVPLLFEKGLDKLVDVKVTVYCPREEQIKRLIKRDSITEELAENIISKQMPIDDKKNASDVIIDNTGAEAELADFLNLF
jgi:dephospho-CoA kinase